MVNVSFPGKIIINVSIIIICSHMNGYLKEIFYNHGKRFLSEKQITTNSCLNMNDEKNYKAIISFIGHPSITFKSH